MSIQQTKKQSDLEKRLRLLRQHLYGRSEPQHISKSNQLKYSADMPTKQTSDSLVKSDISYLYQDLLKIGVLASIAIGVQIILYFLLQNHILKLNLF